MGVLTPELETQGYTLGRCAVTLADASFSFAINKKKIKRLAGTALMP